MLTPDPMVTGPLLYFFCCKLGPGTHHSNMFTSEPTVSIPISELFHILFPLSCSKQPAVLLTWDVPRHRKLTHGSFTPEYTQSTLLEQQFSKIRIF